MNFQFPSLPTENFAEDDASTEPDRDSNRDEAMLPLSESWTSLSVSDFHSEDDAASTHIETASWADQSAIDDGSSIDGGEARSEHPEEEPEQQNEDQETMQESELLGQLARSFESGQGSNLTMKPSYHSSLDLIEFDEPSEWPGEESTEVSYTIRMLDESGDLASIAKSDHCLLSLKKTLSKTSLDLRRPFRMLYVGQTEFRRPILDKLGDVLVANDESKDSSETRRYHVIPTSFGPGSSDSHAELLPIQLQLVVDDCTSAQMSAGVHADIILECGDHSSCKSQKVGDDFHIEGSKQWTSPDICIMVTSTKDDQQLQDIGVVAHTFMERHHIPTLLISDKFSGPESDVHLPIDPKTLHLCVEHQEAATGNYCVLRRLPVDLHTMERVSASQMNRHLTYLISRSHQNIRELPKTCANESCSRHHKSLAHNATKLRHDSVFSDSTKMVIAFLSSLICTLLAVAFYKLLATVVKSPTTNISASVDQNASTIPCSIQSENFAEETGTVFVSGESSSTKMLDFLWGDQGAYGGEAGDPKPEEPIDLGYEVDVVAISPSQVILRPSTHPESLFGPHIVVDVELNGETIPHAMAELADGMFLLELAALGDNHLVNLSLANTEHPETRRRLEIELPYSKDTLPELYRATVLAFRAINCKVYESFIFAKHGVGVLAARVERESIKLREKGTPIKDLMKTSKVLEDMLASASSALVETHGTASKLADEGAHEALSRLRTHSQALRYGWGNCLAGSSQYWRSVVTVIEDSKSLSALADRLRWPRVAKSQKLATAQARSRILWTRYQSLDVFHRGSQPPNDDSTISH